MTRSSGMCECELRRASRQASASGPPRLPVSGSCASREDDEGRPLLDEELSAKSWQIEIEHTEPEDGVGGRRFERIDLSQIVKYSAGWLAHLAGRAHARVSRRRVISAGIANRVAGPQ